MHELLVVSAAFSLLTLVNSDSASWSYHEPNGTSTWKNQFPICGGTRQSPVNIVPKDTVFDAGLKDLNLQYEPEVSAKLENNGHAVQVTFLMGRSNISGGGLSLNSSYRAAQMHFHWGSTDNRGSEHQLQGKAFPMEIHIVHYNADKYGNLTTAMKMRDGLAVFGIFVEIQDSIYPAWNSIINELNKTLYKGESTILQAFKPLSFLPEVWTQYYTYEGSLTTPGCFESVHWIVFNKPVPISDFQLDKFRQLYFADRQSTKKIHLVDNFRPVQPLNGRQITRSFQRPLFPCDKVSDVTMVCSALANDKVVFYNVTVVDLCSLPVLVTLEVSQPDIGFDFVHTVYQDIKIPKQIGELNYGFELEMHSHSREKEAGYLHITVKQVHPFSTDKPNPTEVISKDFSHNVCQLAKCSDHSCDKHWCDGTTIGYGNDTLNLGFSSTIDFSGKLPMVAVDFYRIEAASQHLTAREKFTNGEKKQVLLTGTMVHADDTASVKGRNRRLVKYSQWKLVTFKALISESSDNVIFQLFMIIPTKGLEYKVLKDTYPLQSVCTKPSPAKGLSNRSKIAIGLSVVFLLVILVGVTVGILYWKRKKYIAHRPALVQQIDTQDDDTVGNML